MLNVMAHNINVIVKGCDDPIARIGAINTYLYKNGRWNGFRKFEYDLNDLDAVEKKNNFINGYLDTNMGSCITMPMLYAVLGQRLDYPIHIVESPSHFFCRYVSEDLKENNIEATLIGGHTDDDSYIYNAGITDLSIRNGVYMRTLSNREYISRLMCINARFFFEEGKIDKALSYMEKAVEIDSTNAGGWWNSAAVYYKKAKQLNEMMQTEISIESRLNKSKSDLISEIRLIKESYLPEISKLVKKAKSNRQKAIDMGIILELPERFYIEQQKSIKIYKQTGECK